MRTYHLYISGLDIEVEGSYKSPEKAKTKFLDYLVDNGYIEHTERGAIRPRIRWSDIEPGEFPNDINLNAASAYLPESSSQLDTSSSTMSSLPIRQPATRQAVQPSYADEDYEDYTDPTIIAPSVLPPSNVSAVPNDQDSVFGESPIMSLSKRRRAL